MKLNRNHRKDKWGRQMRRRMRIRKIVIGSEERPRLHVRKTNRHLHVTVHDDGAPGGGVTLLSLGTDVPGHDKKKNYCNIATAKTLGQAIGKALLEKDIKTVVFDRGGFTYHGRIKTLCEAVREAGVTI